MVSKIEPDRYADTGLSLADTPPELNAFLFEQMMRKSGSERLIIGCQMSDSARQLVWSGIPKDLPGCMSDGATHEEAGANTQTIHKLKDFLRPEDQICRAPSAKPPPKKSCQSVS